jgi:signal transduction histidine kinase/CheY-like chemotaxis protein
LVQESDSHALLLDIVDAAIAITSADMGNIQLLDRGSGALRIVANRGFAKPFLHYFRAVHDNGTACGTAMQNGGRVVVEDVTTSPMFADSPALGVLLEAGVRAVQSTPLIGRSGQLVGMLSTHYRAPRVPGERDLRVLDLLARQAADWIERIEARAAVERAKEAAERANRLKDDFLATVSHELRTPLAGMLLWAQLLENHTLSSADAPKALAAIRQSAQVQQQLIEDLLDSSRILAGEMRLHRHQTDLATVAQDAVNIVRPAADAKQIRIEESLDPRVPRVWVDAARMQQVVLNLLNNAIKFSPEGGNVTVGLKRIAGGVQVQVTDAGQGIAPDFLPHIFKRFRQAESSFARQQGGLGLGLSIARELVQLHDGSIRAESLGIGNGATFTVELPVGEAPSDQPVEGRPADPAEAAWRFTPLPVLRGVRALVVEDDAVSRDAMQYLLQKCEADVTAVDNASDALREFESQLWRGRRFDVVLSDIGLSGTNGHDLARQIRASEQRAGQHPVVAVALTAYAREQDRADALAAGFNAHLSKPVGAATLISTLARCLQRPTNPS